MGQPRPPQAMKPATPLPKSAMTLLFTDARLVDPEAELDEPGALLVADGVIQGRWTGARPPKGATVIDCGGKFLAPGIVDWGVKIGEPGERHRELFRSAGLAAAAGGVTTIIARPDTQPAIDTPEVLVVRDPPRRRILALSASATWRR